MIVVVVVYESAGLAQKNHIPQPGFVVKWLLWPYKSYVAPDQLTRSVLQQQSEPSPPPWEEEHAVSSGLGQEQKGLWAKDPWSVTKDLLGSTQESTSKGLAREGGSFS